MGQGYLRATLLTVQLWVSREKVTAFRHADTLPPHPRTLAVPHRPRPHLLAAHEALFLPEVHMVDGQALLCSGLKDHGPIGPRYHSAFPASHL